MAVIRPSSNNLGQDFSDKKMTFNYIRDDVRQIKFDKKNSEFWLYFLPAFNTNGSWYNVYDVRRGFGPGQYGSSYYVKNKELDPSTYFERNYKRIYEKEFEAIKIARKSDRDARFGFGSVSKRVAFNVVPVADLGAGAHVLDLPSFNGADNINKWLNTRNAKGVQNPMLNDPETGFVPVLVRKAENSANPWSFSFDVTAIAHSDEIPEAYLDSDTMYDLTDIFVEKSDDEIITGLREVYAPDVFDACMAGHPSVRKSIAVQAPAPSASRVAVPSARTAVAPIVKTLPSTSASPGPVEEDVDYSMGEQEAEEAPKPVRASIPVPAARTKPAGAIPGPGFKSASDAASFLRK